MPPTLENNCTPTNNYGSGFISRPRVSLQLNGSEDNCKGDIGPNQRLYEEQYKSRVDDLLLRNKAKLKKCVYSEAKDRYEGWKSQRKEDGNVGPCQHMYTEQYEEYVNALLHRYKSKLHPPVARGTNETAKTTTINHDCVPPRTELSPSYYQQSTQPLPTQDEIIYDTQDGGRHCQHNSQRHQGKQQFSCRQKSISSHEDDEDTTNGMISDTHIPPKQTSIVGENNHNSRDYRCTTDKSHDVGMDGRSKECSDQESFRLHTVRKDKSHHLQTKNKIGRSRPNTGEDSSLSSIELARRGDRKGEDDGFRSGAISPPSSPTMKLFRSPSYTNAKLKKRLASTSGKKGTDMRRMRHDEHSLSNEHGAPILPYEESEGEMAIENYSFDHGVSDGPLHEENTD